MNPIKRHARAYAGIAAVVAVVLGVGISFYTMHRANITTFDNAVKKHNEVVLQLSELYPELSSLNRQLEFLQNEAADEFLPVLETVKLAPLEILKPNQRAKISSLAIELELELSAEQVNLEIPTKLPEEMQTSSEGAVVNRSSVEMLEKEVAKLASENESLTSAVNATENNISSLINLIISIEGEVRSFAPEILESIEYNQESFEKIKGFDLLVAEFEEFIEADQPAIPESNFSSAQAAPATHALAKLISELKSLNTAR